MSFRQLLRATCDATFATCWSNATKSFLWKATEKVSKSQSKQTFLQLDQVNFKEQVVSSFLAADIPLHKLNHSSLKSLFATMGKVLPSVTAARAYVAKLASKKKNKFKNYFVTKEFFNCG